MESLTRSSTNFDGSKEFLEVMGRLEKSNLSFNGLDAEVVLYDALNTVCKHLNARDLANVAQVSKFWNQVAKHEIAKRSYIQRLYIPFKSKNITDRLQVRPEMALVFLGSNIRLGHKRLEREVLDVYGSQLPNKLIALEVSEYLTDEDPIFDNSELSRQVAMESARGCSNGILGLFLPEFHGSRLTIAMCRYRSDDNILDNAERMLDRLFDEPARPKSTVIVFAYTIIGFFIAEQLVGSIRRRYEEKRETIWGGLFSKEMVATDWAKPRRRPSSSDKACVALRISGGSFESWSSVIKCSSTREEVDQRLRELNARIRRKRFCLGLVYGPRHIREGSPLRMYRSNHELMRAVKRLIPGVPLVGLFDKKCSIPFTDQTVNDGQKFGNCKYMSLLILSYD